jgi:prevent-host-death family protein
MIQLSDIHSLTDFKRNTAEFVRQVHETKNPLVLTVNGKASVVVQDAASFQDLLDRVERAEMAAALRQSMDEHDKGQGRPARAALEELRQELGRIPH